MLGDMLEREVRKGFEAFMDKPRICSIFVWIRDFIWFFFFFFFLFVCLFVLFWWGVRKLCTIFIQHIYTYTRHTHRNIFNYIFLFLPPINYLLKHQYP